MKEEFEKWQRDTLYESEVWAVNLKEEALKQTTYQDALDFLDKSQPEITDFGSWMAIKKFHAITDLIFNDVKKEIIKQALAGKIKHD